MAKAFFIRLDDDEFEATDFTQGPWAPGEQHGGPPAALLGRAIEAVGNGDAKQVARITFEILRPIPVARLRVRAEVSKPGRSVELVDAVLSDGKGDVVRARAWRIRTGELDIADAVREDPPPPGPDGGARVDFLTNGTTGYWAGMEWSFMEGSFLEPGPATGWLRMRHPLIDGEPIDPLTRVLIAADSGNGFSGALDFSRFVYVNPDLTVYLHRMPEGEWICLDAVTYPESNGIGLAASVISDQRSTIGRGLQSLFLGARKT